MTILQVLQNQNSILSIPFLLWFRISAVFTAKNVTTRKPFNKMIHNEMMCFLTQKICRKSWRQKCGRFRIQTVFCRSEEIKMFYLFFSFRKKSLKKPTEIAVLFFYTIKIFSARLQGSKYYCFRAKTFLTRKQKEFRIRS
jgi:hypothetical protein